MSVATEFCIAEPGCGGRTRWTIVERDGGGEVATVIGPWERAQLVMAALNAAAAGMASPAVPVAVIRAAAAREFGLPEARLRGEAKDRVAERARALAILLARDITGQSDAMLGRAFGLSREGAGIARRRAERRLAGDDSELLGQAERILAAVTTPRAWATQRAAMPQIGRER